ncbi:CoB--CoM heterodisulfide reductase subunit B [Methanolobus profundi]|uniref:CoB--CoM heterodisulfide reductase subunit B n=1 Tax=Methanolobus profundi TaxID=487685 RepID=A0A1I4TMF5_9EURY|nr:CoB--CoM heterodisulfide reductase subunit B [Methanolobus profundi]SFM77924.1 CoB--CoM heterodisulfide reductase subunit B [Methanolobus profundi]
MKGLSLFLGCVVPNRYPGIEMATKLCLAKLDIDCVDLESASCCPAPGVFRSFDRTTWLTLASRNIVLSEQKERDMLTICNGCFSTLEDANRSIKHDEGSKEEVNKHLRKIGREIKGDIDVRHIIEYLYQEHGPEKIASFVEKQLDIRVAVHYGCHLIKPTKDRELGNFERPAFFDELVTALGATSVDYPDKMACCGAGGGVRSAMKEKSLGMTRAKLSRIEETGVDCIVNSCPFCHMQLDAGQTEIKEMNGPDFNIPVLHYTQLLGLALGFPPEMLGIDTDIEKNRTLTDLLDQQN